MKRSQSEKAARYAESRDEATKRGGRKLSESAGRKTADGREDTMLMRCFNCGAGGHQARNCDKRSLGKKCFVCNKFGHEAKNCSEKSGP